MRWLLTRLCVKLFSSLSDFIDDSCDTQCLWFCLSTFFSAYLCLEKFLLIYLQYVCFHFHFWNAFMEWVNKQNTGISETRVWRIGWPLAMKALFSGHKWCGLNFRSMKLSLNVGFQDIGTHSCYLRCADVTLLHCFLEIQICYFYLTCKTEIQRPFIYWFIAQMPTPARTGPDWAHKLKVSSVSYDWQEPKYMSQHIVPPRVCPRRLSQKHHIHDSNQALHHRMQPSQAGMLTTEPNAHIIKWL